MIINQFVYLLHFKPFASKQANRLEIFNEIMVMIACVYHLIAFSEITHDASVAVRMAIGWSFIGTVLGVMIPANFFIMIYNTTCAVWSYRPRIKYYFNRYILRKTYTIKLKHEEPSTEVN